VATAPASHKKIALDLTVRLGRSVDVNKHWQLLGGLIDDGVRASGTAVDHWVKGPLCKTEEHLPGMLPIGAAEDLVLWDDNNGETWLAPHNRLLLGGGGRFWKRVRIHRLDLMAALGHDTTKREVSDATSMQCSVATEESGHAKSKSPCAPEIWQAATQQFPQGIPREFGPTKLKSYLEPVLKQTPGVRVPASTGFAAVTYGRALKKYPRK
jgi:hypothetical protein